MKYKVNILYFCSTVIFYLIFANIVKSATSTVQLTVGFPAGGTSDILARQIADDLNKTTSTKIIVQNKPGAGGLIALKSTASNNSAPELILQLIFNDLYHDNSIHEVVSVTELDNLKPVVVLGTSPLLIVASNSSKIKNINDLKTTNKKIKVGTSGPGGVTYSQAKNLEKFIGKEFTFVNYRTASHAYPDLYRGDIDIMVDFYTTAITHAVKENVNPIGLINSNRLSAFNQIPTTIEQGMNKNNLPYFLILASPGTEDTLIKNIKQSMTKILSISADPYIEKGVFVDLKNTLNSQEFYKNLVKNYKLNE